MSNRIPEMNLTSGSILTRRAFLEPDKEAIVFRDRRLTYQQLEERANSIANASLQLGIAHSDRAAVLMYNSNEYLEIVFGMAKIGAVVVLINFRLVAREIEFILNDSGAKALFYGAQFADLVDQIKSNVSSVERYICVGGKSEDLHYDQLLRQGDSRTPDATVLLEDYFQILYTAGTTGRPKGALITHRNSFYSTITTITSTRVTPWRPLVAGPLFHVASINANSIPCVFAGGTQVVLDAFDPELALQTIEKERSTISTGVPLFAKLMLEVQKEKNYDISSFQKLIIGGAPVPPQLIKGWLEFGVRLVEIYGGTETTTWACFCDDNRIMMEKEGSAGQPAFFTNLRIVDDQDQDVMTGEVGEIIVRGECVIKAYWNRPEENHLSFRNEWFHTGDLGRLDQDGFLYVVDRKKDMIKTGGENVYPAELELVLMEHPAIDAVAVVGTPDPRWEEAVSAAVVLKKGYNLTEDELVEFCRANMARYKVPKVVRFVDQLPRNVMGKILKHEVRKFFSWPVNR